MFAYGRQQAHRSDSQSSCDVIGTSTCPIGRRRPVAPVEMRATTASSLFCIAAVVMSIVISPIRYHHYRAAQPRAAGSPCLALALGRVGLLLALALAECAEALNYSQPTPSESTSSNKEEGLRPAAHTRPVTTPSHATPSLGHIPASPCVRAQDARRKTRDAHPSTLGRLPPASCVPITRGEGGREGRSTTQVPQPVLRQASKAGRQAGRRIARGKSDGRARDARGAFGGCLGRTRSLLPLQ